MFKSLVAVAGVTILAVSAPAEAGSRDRTVSAQGWGGHGYVHSRSISRAPGSAAASRSFQTNSGRGITSSRNANRGDGSYSGGATHTLNNGNTFGRATTATRNADGSVSYSSTHTGINGSGRTVSGTANPY